MTTLGIHDILMRGPETGIPIGVALVIEEVGSDHLLLTLSYFFSYISSYMQFD